MYVHMLYIYLGVEQNRRSIELGLLAAAITIPIVEYRETRESQLLRDLLELQDGTVLGPGAIDQDR